MKRVSQKEADELISEFIRLKKKSRRSKSAKVQKEFRDIHQKCVVTFDYLVTSRIRRYKKFSNYEDLYQDGRIALLLALESYDQDKGNFFWWAKQYIKTKISREANRHSTIKIPMRLARDIQPYKVSEMPVLIDAAPDPFQSQKTKEVREHINRAIDMLPETHRRIIRLNGIEEHSINKIAEDLKISKVNCIKLLNEARESLKQNLESLNY